MAEPLTVLSLRLGVLVLVALLMGPSSGFIIPQLIRQIAPVAARQCVRKSLK